MSNSNVARRGEIPATSGTDRRPLPNGIWGGQGISLEITDGGVEINFDCAHGRIQGKKEAVGTFTLKRGNNGQVGKCM